MARKLPPFLAVILLAAATSPVLAEAFPQLEHQYAIVADRWGVEAGWFTVDFKTEFRAGTPALIGTVIRLEDTLNLDENVKTGWLGGFYRFKPKHAITVAITRMNRDATTTLKESIEIGEDDDLVFDIGVAVDSKFNQRVMYLMYQYSFINNGRTEAGLRVGVSAFQIELGLAGSASVNGAPPSQVGESYSLPPIPVPGLGAFITHGFTKNFILRLSGTGLDFEIGDIDLRLLTSRTTIEYFFVKNVGIGGGFFGTDLDFSDNTDNTPISVEYRFGGVVAYFLVGFGRGRT